MIEREIDSLYTWLQSQQTVQTFLRANYERMGDVDAETKSYENCNAFMYYIEHGLHFYESGKKMNIIVQPVMYFYGMTHLLKALLLTKRPNYPETTKVLAHGVSSRKRKKQNYTFIEDEVKVQHNGLFPYFSQHLFGMTNISTKKYKMHTLLSLIPEMHSLFLWADQQQLIEIGTADCQFLTFPTDVLDHYHLTESAFLQRLTRYLPNIIDTQFSSEHISIELSHPLHHSVGPFYIHSNNKTIYFPKQRSHFLPLTELMIHYLLLYNLSMLCRYETEWWGELIATKPDIDYPYIKHFLKHIAYKTPLLLGYELYETYDLVMN